MSIFSSNSSVIYMSLRKLSYCRTSKIALHILDKSIQNLLEDSLFSLTRSRHTTPRVHMLNLTNLFPITYETHEIANRGTTYLCWVKWCYGSTFLPTLDLLCSSIIMHKFPKDVPFLLLYHCNQAYLLLTDTRRPIHFFYYLLSIPDLTVITFISIIFPSFHEEHLALNPIPHDPYSIENHFVIPHSLPIFDSTSRISIFSCPPTLI